MPNADDKIPESNGSQENAIYDHNLWQKVKNFSHGDIQERVEAISIIFGQRKKLPPQCMDLARELTNVGQPKEVRIALAKSLGSSSALSTKEYFSFLKILAKDPDREVSQIIETVLENLGQQSISLATFRNGVNEAINEIRAKERLTILNFMSRQQKAMAIAAGSIPKHQQEAMAKAAGSFQKRQHEVFEQLSGKTFAPIIGKIGIANQYPIKAIFDPIVSYYPVSELSAVETEIHVPPRSKADTYMKMLHNCKPGQKYWKEYEDLCNKILTYCLVPPLQDSIEQSSNLNRMHKRDIIFHIPHDIGEFWNWIIIKWGLAIVVECKNYDSTLKENEVIITSKYLGRKKLTTLGMMLSRKGAGESAQKAQIDEWVHHDVLIICLDDDNLIKMLELREKDQEPCKVIDNAIRKLLQSV